MNLAGLLICALSILQKCSSESALLNSSPRIINGTVASNGNTKHQVSIRLKAHDYRFGDGYICGGSLIGPKKVLTAAHCVYNSDKKVYYKAKDFVVVMGTMNLREKANGTIVSDVSSIAYLGTFDMESMRDDVALLFLKRGLPVNKTHLTVATIPLSNSTIVPRGSICQVSGWGRTEKGRMSNILLTTNVSLIDRRVCSVAYGTRIRDGMICAGHLRGGTDSCQGDSGGPLVHNGTLIGVVSWGNGCALPGFPGVYADVGYYYDWIMKTNGGGKGYTWGTLLTVICLMVLQILGNNFVNLFFI